MRLCGSAACARLPRGPGRLSSASDERAPPPPDLVSFLLSLRALLHLEPLLLTLLARSQRCLAGLVERKVRGARHAPRASRCRPLGPFPPSPHSLSRPRPPRPLSTSQNLALDSATAWHPAGVRPLPSRAPGIGPSSRLSVRRLTYLALLPRPQIPPAAQATAAHSLPSRLSRSSSPTRAGVRPPPLPLRPRPRPRARPRVLLAAMTRAAAVGAVEEVDAAATRAGTARLVSSSSSARRRAASAAGRLRAVAAAAVDGAAVRRRAVATRRAARAAAFRAGAELVRPLPLSLLLRARTTC